MMEFGDSVVVVVVYTDAQNCGNLDLLTYAVFALEMQTLNLIPVSSCGFWLLQLGKGKDKAEHLYSALHGKDHFKALRHASHSFTCNKHHACLTS